MIYIGVREALANWQATIIRSLHMAFLGYLIGYFWFTVTGDRSYMLYVIVAELVMFNRARVSWEVSKLIRTGRLDVWLTRPGSLYSKLFSIFMGRVVTGYFLSLLLVFPMFLLFGMPNFWYLPLALLAFVVEYSFSVTVGYLSFWVGDTQPFRFVVDKIKFLFSGVVVPLEFFPGWLAFLSKVLPFRFMAYVPAKAMVGQFNPIDLLIGLLWVAFLYVVALVVEKKGVKKYEMVGG